MALFKKLLGLKQVPGHWYHRLDAGGDTIEITYLGTAGFIIRHPHRTLVLDPYLSRHDLRHTLTAKLQIDQQLVRETVPHADDVLIGHAHFDHILDGPEICLQTGARLIGSRATMMVGRAAGVPERQLVETAGREDIPCGDWIVRGLPSIHGKAAAGRVLLPGDITRPPPWPPRVGDLRHGLVLNWLVDTGGLRIVHIDSADFINRELRGLRADVVCLCAVGRQYRPGYVKEVVELLRPRWIIPCHWDTMLTPLRDAPDLMPGVDLPGFVAEVRAAGVEPLLTPMLGSQHFPACGCGDRAMHREKRETAGA